MDARVFIVALTTAGLGMATPAHAAMVIESVTASPAADENPENDNVGLTAFSAAATSYDQLIPATSASNLSGEDRFFGRDASATDNDADIRLVPPSDGAAIGDFNLLTGIFNVGAGAIFDLPAVRSTDSLYIFSLGQSSNLAEPGDVTLVNSSGTAVTQPLDLGNELSVSQDGIFTITVSRDGRESLDRILFGIVLPVTDFTLLPGRTYADAAALRTSTANFDPAEIGIVVPEPAAALWLVGGAWLATRRRR
jgi:hypothetical protein